MFVLAACLPAQALESSLSGGDHAGVSLISAVDSVQQGHSFRVGVRFRLSPGWHIYWRNPGDAGAAPELTFSLPTGAQAGPVAWPTPQRLPEGPVMTFGYTNEVLLPIRIDPGDADVSRGFPVKVQADWLVCHQICVPGHGTFALDLPPGEAAPGDHAVLFAQADRQMPQQAPWPMHVTPGGELLWPRDVHDQDLVSAWFFPQQADQVLIDAPQALARAADGWQLRIRKAPGFQSAQALEGVLVVQDHLGQTQSWVVKAASVSAPPVSAPASGPDTGSSLWIMLVMGVLGGVLLNAMPCVFPILAMKALALARLSGAERHHVRREALAYALGIVTSFTALGGCVAVLRATQQAVGWGFQFQSPLFVTAMLWLLLAIGLNLSGVFQLGGGWAGTGQGWVARGGWLGSFAAGVLAVVVATPCLGPFMGATVAAALVAPWPMTVILFAALGGGLGAPALFFAAWPQGAALLPRPGAWMEILRQALAFPLYAAFAWLLWVVSVQGGTDAVAVASAGGILIGLACWAVGVGQRSHRTHARRLGMGIAILAVSGALLLLPRVRESAAGGGQETKVHVAQAEGFTRQRLLALRAQDRPVFVNITAAWCVTCLINEKLVLSSSAVQASFRQHGVSVLEGDWTRQDAQISAFLREWQRDGVPLYLFYPAGNGAPQVLPQILTPVLLERMLNSP